MSNAKKVIKLRPIERKKPISQNEEVSESHLKTLEQKIELAEAKLKQLEQKQAGMIHETKVNIQTEKEQWKIEKQSMIKEAKQIGYHEGFTKGETDSLEQYKQKIYEANALIETASKDYQATIDKSKDTIIALAIHTAEKIINQHIQNDPKAFCSIVEAAIQTINTDKKITIYVHPNQFNFLIKQKEELQNSINGQAQLEIYIDKNSTENSCLIEHPFGKVDASIDTQLEQIRSVLQNVSNGE